MAYTLDQIKAYADQMLASGATYTDVANAAQQFGVPLDQVYGAYGIGADTGANLLASQPLTGQQVSEGRNWINGLGYGNFNFDGDFLQSVANAKGGYTGGLAGNVLGAGLAMGYDANALSQITGVPVENVQNYMGDFSQNQLNGMSVSGARELGYITPEEYRSFVMQNANGGVNSPGAVSYTGGYDGSLQFDPSMQRGGQSGSVPSSFDPGLGRNPAFDGRANRSGGGARRLQGDGGGEMTIQPYPNPTAGNTSGTASMMPSNQYLGGIADSITQRLNENYQRMLPAISDQAIAAGGLGGSRQGVAQGLAMEGTQDALASALSGLYGGAYESDANRGLQRYGIDQQTGLGWGNLGLGVLNSDRSYNLGLGSQGLQQQSINNQFQLGNQGQWMNYDLGNRQQDTTDALAGSSIYSQGLRDQWYPTLAYGGLLNGLASGYGTSTTGSSSGGGLGGAIGGGLLGLSLYNQFNRG